MGLYSINCPECKEPFMWFSGNQLDQHCGKCRKTTLETKAQLTDSPKPETPMFREPDEVMRELDETKYGKPPKDSACICSHPDMFGHGEKCPMSMEYKGSAREFWLTLGAYLKISGVPVSPSPEETIHVIEYAAFEKLQRELDHLKNNSIPLESFNVSVPSTEWYDTIKERDKLQASLDAKERELASVRKDHEDDWKRIQDVERDRDDFKKLYEDEEAGFYQALQGAHRELAETKAQLNVITISRDAHVKHWNEEKLKSAALVEAFDEIANRIDLSEWQNEFGSASLAFFEASKMISSALARFKETE